MKLFLGRFQQGALGELLFRGGRSLSKSGPGAPPVQPLHFHRVPKSCATGPENKMGARASHTLGWCLSTSCSSQCELSHGSLLGKEMKPEVHWERHFYFKEYKDQLESP